MCPEADAVKTVLKNFDIQVGISLEGDGMYVQQPKYPGHLKQALDDLSHSYAEEHSRMKGQRFIFVL